MNITIIGCGHGGQALATQLSMSGNNVTIYADKNHPGYLDGIENNSIDIEGKINGSAFIHCLTKNVETAIKNAEVIYISLPTSAHVSQFKKIAPHLKKGQMVVTLEGNFSSIYFYQLLKNLGKEKEVYIADIASLPYACRTIKAGKINIIDIKKSIDIAAMPSKHTDVILDKITSHFPTKLTKLNNIIELGLNTIGALIHPAIMLMNAGRIGKNGEEFYFYREGISQEISNIIEALDYDRQQIAFKYGFNLLNFMKMIELFYSQKYSSYYAFFTQSVVHNKLKLCPSSMSERYISQDVPYVISPWYRFGLHIGYDSDVMHAIIIFASILNKKNYYEERNIVKDFFENMSKESMFDFLFNGYS